jgi:hypothetical protein
MVVQMEIQIRTLPKKFKPAVSPFAPIALSAG